MSTISNLEVDLSLNTARFIAGIHKARKEHEDFTKSLSEIGSKAGDLAESLGVESGGNFSINGMMEAAKAAEDSQTKLKAVLAATGEAAGINAEGMAQIADELARVTTFGQNASRSAETVLSTFSHVKGDQFREAMKSAADLATVFGTDLTTAAKNLGRALENPEDGLKRLAKMGVQFTQDQKATIKSLEDLGDMAGAQQVILDAINKKVGGSAEAAAKTASGAFQQFKNEMEEVAAKIGSTVLPVVKDVQNVAGGITAAVNGAKSAWQVYTQAQEMATVAAKAFSGTPLGALLAAGAAAVVMIGLLVEKLHSEAKAHEDAAKAAANHAAELKRLAQSVAADSSAKAAADIAALQTKLQEFSTSFAEQGPGQKMAEQIDKWKKELEKLEKVANQPHSTGDLRKSQDDLKGLGHALGSRSVLDDWLGGTAGLRKQIEDAKERNAEAELFAARRNSEIDSAKIRADGLRAAIAQAEQLRKTLTDAAEHKTALEAFDKLQRKAEALRESLRTPIEKFHEQIQEFRQAFAHDPGMLSHGFRHALEELSQALGQPETPKFLAAGSREADNAWINRDRENPQLEILRKSLDAELRAAQAAEDMLRLPQNMGNVDVQVGM